MINSIITDFNSKYLTATTLTNGSSSVTSGSLRMENGILEAYNGYSWVPASGQYSTVNLSPSAVRILDWADQKMAEEANEQQLIEKYPSLGSAKGQYEMIKKICQAEENLDNTNRV